MTPTALKWNSFYSVVVVVVVCADNEPRLGQSAIRPELTLCDDNVVAISFAVAVVVVGQVI